jgi:transcription elongation GreA/GreB family factor
MTISRRIQDLLAHGDFDDIEGDWLAAVASEPGEVGYFVGVARALVGQGEEERARLLLQLYDEHLRDGGMWSERLRLLERAGAILQPTPETLHDEILATLEKLYGERSAFAGLVETVGLHRAPHDTPKTWEKVKRLASLVVFDVGDVVAMEGKGAGRITEVNLGLQSFRIDFESAPRLAVGFRAAPKVLAVLAPDHVLRRKLEDLPALRALAGEDPSELLRIVLASYGRPLTAGEVRAALAGVVDEGGWTSWWAAARRNPLVVAAGSGRQTYSWADSSADAVDSVWRRFAEADPRQKVELLRRDGDREVALRARMEEALLRLGEEVAGTDPGLAAELWFALERIGRAPAAAAWAPAALLAADPQRTLAGVADRALRERAFGLLRQGRSDWPSLYLEALSREEDPRTLDLLAAGLAEAAPGDLDRFMDAVLIYPHKTPAAFAWVAERAAGDPQLLARNPLRLLQQILTGPARDELAPYRSRLVALCASGGTVPRLLALLSEEQAPQAAEAVERAVGLEGYQREDLQRALELRFPALRREAAAAPLYALPASIAAKRAELEEILKAEIPANRVAIAEARAMGDLRENFEYKAARQRHEYLTARATQLKEELHRARPLDLASPLLDEVRIGTRVRLAGDGGERSVTLLGPWESRPEEGVISYESEQGRLLLGKKPGEQVTLGGTPLTVAAIESLQP